MKMSFNAGVRNLLGNTFLATNILVTGKQVIEKLKQKEVQAEEFAHAAEFAERNQRNKG